MTARPSPARPSSSVATWALVLLAGLGAACSQAPAGKSDLEVAQVAIRANPALELVATDEGQGVLTVRVRSTGQLVTVKAADVNAGTAFTAIALDGGATVTTAPAAQAATGGATADVRVDTPAGSVTVTREQGAPSAPAEPAAAASTSGAGIGVTAERRGAATDYEADRRASVGTGGVGVTAQRSGDDKNVRINTPVGTITAQRDAAGNARVTTPQTTVTRQGATSQVSVPGSGVTVTKDAATQTNTATVAAGGWVSVASAGQRLRTAANTCRQGEVATIANANFEINGTAVVVETGCVLTIRGSRIAGGDTAIVVKMGGSLTLEGSTVEGRRTAIQFDMGSTGAVRGSTIFGRVAKANGATVTEQGNTYK